MCHGLGTGGPFLVVPFTDMAQVSMDDYIKLEKFPPCVLAKGLFPAMKTSAPRVLIPGGEMRRGGANVGAANNESLEGLY